MRWDSLTPDETPALFDSRPLARTFDTPGFRGMTFYEVHAKSIINRVPASSRMSFGWTINPYRGCGHACVYCFARNTHTYLDLDAGHDFDSKVVVKVNAPDLARRELSAARWRGDLVAMGTNVDCYQRAEGRYALMPGIISALRDHRNPFSILTKGTLILRDLDLIADAAEITDVTLNVSVGFVDKELSRLVEPGTPSPERRLGICAALGDRGLRCGVLMGPVLPYLSDSPAQLARPSPPPPRPARPASPRSCCTCGPAPGSGTSNGWPSTTPAWSRPTGSCTAPAPTPRAPIRSGSAARSAS